MRSVGIPVGFSGLRTASWDPLTVPHMLVSGPTGSGKSSAVLQVLGGLSASAYGTQWRATIVDAKGGLDFAPFDRYVPVVASPGASSAVAACAALVVTRLALLRAARLTHARQWPGVVPMLPHLLVLDELADLLAGFDMTKTDAAALRDDLGLVLRMGRAAGVHVLASILRPDAASFGRDHGGMVRDQFGARLLLGAASEDHHRMLGLPALPGGVGRGASVGLTHGPELVVPRVSADRSALGLAFALGY